MVARSPCPGGRRGHKPPRRPSRRPLGSQEGDRRRPHRAASTARRIFFASGEVATPLKGSSPPSGGNSLRRHVARARGPGGASAATPRSGPAGAGGAEQQQRGEGVGAASATGEAPESVAARTALVERHAELFGELPATEGRKPRYPTRALAAILDRALARLDCYADFGAGRTGAGLEYALALVEADVEEVRWNRRREAPVSAAYYAPLLDEVSKEWRRKSAPTAAALPPGWRGSWAHPKAKRRRAGQNRAPAVTSQEE